MRSDHLDPSLVNVLGVVANETRSAAEPWWIIGSAAAALHGVNLPVADVDLLLTSNDAARLLQRMGGVMPARRRQAHVSPP